MKKNTPQKPDHSTGEFPASPQPEGMRLRALLCLTAVLAIIGTVVVIGSALAINDARQNLVTEAKEEARVRAEGAAQRIIQVMRSEKVSCLDEIVKHPEIRAQLDVIYNDDCVVLAALYDNEDQLLFEKFCPITFPSGLPETASAPENTIDPLNRQMIIKTAGTAGIPEDVIPVRLPVVVEGRRMGSVALGFSEKAALGRVEMLGAQITTSLSILISVVLVTLMMTLVLLYMAFIRLMSLQQRQAQSAHLAAIGSLAKGLAHEIRNPLHAMNLHLECVREELEDTEVEVDRGSAAGVVNGVQSQIANLEDTVRGFIAYALPGRLELEPTQLCALVAENIETTRSKVDGCAVEIRNEVAADLWVSADSSALRQVFQGVLLNGIEAVEGCERQLIRVSSEEGRKCHRLLIEDSGPGFDPEVLSCLFKGVVTRPCGGLGFGLAIAQRLIEDHGGTVRVSRSTDLGGARVEIQLPASSKS